MVIYAQRFRDSIGCLALRGVPGDLLAQLDTELWASDPDALCLRSGHWNFILDGLALPTLHLGFRHDNIIVTASESPRSEPMHAPTGKAQQWISEVAYGLTDRSAGPALIDFITACKRPFGLPQNLWIPL
jgi:hypothetical protein